MNDPKGGVAKVTCPTFEAMGQIPVFHRTYFLLLLLLLLLLPTQMRDTNSAVSTTSGSN